ncbi:MAG: hypothetical protein WD768_21560 [Phycisphaeraceae bacterium]
MFQEVEVLRAAVCMAGLDGNISEKEMKLIKQLADHCGVGAASLKAMMDKAVSDPNYYQSQLRYLRGNPDETMKVLLRIAVADGALHPNERVILQVFATKLNIESSRFEQLLAAAESAVAGE